jgi:hypothetical protein
MHSIFGALKVGAVIMAIGVGGYLAVPSLPQASAVGAAPTITWLGKVVAALCAGRRRRPPL